MRISDLMSTNVVVVDEKTLIHNAKKIMEILDKKKTLLLSLMTLRPDEEKEDWLVVLRLETENADPIVKELGSAGFNVTDVN